MSHTLYNDYGHWSDENFANDNTWMSSPDNPGVLYWWSTREIGCSRRPTYTGSDLENPNLWLHKYDTQVTSDRYFYVGTREHFASIDYVDPDTIC